MKIVLKTYENQFDKICNFYTHHFLKETMVLLLKKVIEMSCGILIHSLF